MPSSISAVVADPAVDESAGSTTFIVMWNADTEPGRQYSVEVCTESSSAGPFDYSPISPRLQISTAPSGSDSSGSIAINDDTESDEGTESFNIRAFLLFSDDGGMTWTEAANTSSSVAIIDNDPGMADPMTTDPGVTDPATTDPGVTDPATTDPSVPETDPGPGPETGATTVNLLPIPDAGGDIEIVAGQSITLDASGTTDDGGPMPLLYRWCLNVDPLAGATAEGVRETFTWGDLESCGWQSGFTNTVDLLVTDGSVDESGNTVWVSDSLEVHVKPSVTIAVLDGDASEKIADDNQNPGSFIVTRTGDTSEPLVVTLLSPGGTATYGQGSPDDDYKISGATTTSVTIETGQVSATITIRPENDREVEQPETVVFRLEPGAEYHIPGGTQATLTITDNDKWEWDGYFGGTGATVATTEDHKSVNTGGAEYAVHAIEDFDHFYDDDTYGQTLNNWLTWMSSLGESPHPSEYPVSVYGPHSYLFTRHLLTPDGGGGIRAGFDALYTDPGFAVYTQKQASVSLPFSFTFSPTSGEIVSLGPGGGNSGGITTSGDLNIGAGYNVSINNADPFIHYATVTMSWLVSVNRAITYSGSWGSDEYGVEIGASQTSNAGISVSLPSSITLRLVNSELPD